MNKPNAINPTTGEVIHVGIYKNLPAGFVWVWEFDTEDWLNMSIRLYSRIDALKACKKEAEAMAESITSFPHYAYGDNEAACSMVASAAAFLAGGDTKEI